LGLAAGSAWSPQPLLAALLPAAWLLGLLLSVWLHGLSLGSGLPLLGFAYLPAIWVLQLAAARLQAQAAVSASLAWAQGFDAQLGDFGRCYLRAMSGLLFQPSLEVGLLLSLGLLLHSRIAFALSLLGLGSAWTCLHLAGADPCAFSSPAAGFNFALTAIALGGVFTVPSRTSLAMALLLVPATLLLALGLEPWLSTQGLGLFGLPYAMIACAYVAALRARPWTANAPTLGPWPHESPETSLYRHAVQAGRLSDQHDLPLRLPFLGRWTVTQGDEGALTHKGKWAHALDFELLDPEGQRHHGRGLELADFESWGKPVLAPAAGVVEALIDGIEDNQPGRINTEQNWGNSLVLRLAPGLYAQLSHLKKGSLRVKLGDWVAAGQVLALCGNSGRSPVPHLHFQLQGSPTVGAPSMPYPLRRYLVQTPEGLSLRERARPVLGEQVEDLQPERALRELLELAPGQTWRLEGGASGAAAQTRLLDGGVDLQNFRTLRCRQSGAVARLLVEPDHVRVIDYRGPAAEPLHQLCLALYKLPLDPRLGPASQDALPIDSLRLGPWRWLQDLCGSLGLFIHAQHRVRIEGRGAGLGQEGGHWEAEQRLSLFGRERVQMRLQAAWEPGVGLRFAIDADGQRSNFSLRRDDHA
jgi:murein DD-endopeptidase MepM/ murein hydrolase activator NlpD